ncbi:hypothetical protein EV363DRAFT_1222137 [Boletus edulis]|nr:hypothetical protein EV363DRAFT_1222137 [Boletus edulis]
MGKYMSETTRVPLDTNHQVHMTASLATMPFHQGDVDWVFARAMLLPKRPVITAQLMLRRDFASRIPECSRPPALAGVSRVHCN